MKSWNKWNEEDNKEEIGAKDRIWVSETESWEIRYFITEYIKSKDIKSLKTAEAKLTIARLIKKYPGKAPIKRDDLTKYLDKELLGV